MCKSFFHIQLRNFVNIHGDWSYLLAAGYHSANLVEEIVTVSNMKIKGKKIPPELEQLTS